MTTDRITLADIEARVGNVNRRLTNGRKVFSQGRNGYIGLDEYYDNHDATDCQRIHGDSYCNSGVMVRTITCGTKREIGEFLNAMMVGIDLAA